MDENRLRTLVDYFKKNFEKGYKKDSLKWALINQGYSRSIVSRALQIAEKEIQKTEDSKKEKPKIKYELYGADEKPFIVTSNITPWWKKIMRSFKNL